MTLVIAVTGRVGSGKSRFQTIAEHFSEVACIDLDKLGHEVLRIPTVQSQLRKAFGEVVFNMEGEVNRQILAKLVFQSSEAILTLNHISHPAIVQRAQKLIEACPKKLCFVFGSLVQEVGLLQHCDHTVVIDAEDNDIYAKIGDKFLRHQFQLSRTAFLDLADVVIMNTFNAQFDETVRRVVHGFLAAKESK